VLVAELSSSEEGRIDLVTEWADRERVKLVPGARWDADASTWWVPLSWPACVQLRGVFGSELRVGERLDEWARAEIGGRVAPCLDLRTATDAPDLMILSALRPFQRAGVKFLTVARHALLADEMGLGKTVQAIAALETLEAQGEQAYPALVVCPSSMKATWAEEFKRWARSRRVQVVRGGPATKRKQIALLREGEADVCVVNYEALRSHTRLARYGSMTLSDAERTPKELNEVEWATVIADEAHRAKDPMAKQTRALWYLGDRVRNRFALTGTPVANSPEDMWSIMRFVAPTEFPAKTKFVERYAVQSWSIHGYMKVIGLRPEAKDELFSIIDPRMIRRLKAAVLPQMQPKTYQTRYVEMAPKQRRVYDQMRKEMLAQLDGGTLVAANPLHHTTRLLQFASAYATMEETGALKTDGTPDTRLVMTEPSCKVDALVEIVDELGDQQAVVFTVSRQLNDICAAKLARMGVPVGQLTGGVSEADRAINVARFQRGELKVLLVLFGVGGEGLTLTAATVAIFLQRDWSAIKNAQAEDRIHRMGQDKAVSIIDVVSQDSIEARVHAARQTKAERLEEMVRDADTLRSWLE
jgi:SNF2 family DNA or RNA helicase